MKDETTYLYRHYDSSDCLLYVGISLNAFSRLYQHKIGSDWFQEISRVDIEKHESRKIALKAEREAIKKEKPKYNIQHTKQNKPGLSSLMQNKQESENGLLKRVLGVRPLYDIPSIPHIIGLGSSYISHAIKNGHLGTVKVAHEWRGETKYKEMVTGWQLIDYLEFLENEAGY